MDGQRWWRGLARHEEGQDKGMDGAFSLSRMSRIAQIVGKFYSSTPFSAGCISPTNYKGPSSNLGMQL